MRIISLVPSWTETLVRAGANVVGRTRFCIHPETVKSIPAVGGTKDADWVAIRNLNPDVILLDKEENPKAFFDEAVQIAKPIVTHIEDLQSLIYAFNELSVKLSLPILSDWSGQLRARPSLIIKKRIDELHLDWLTPKPMGSMDKLKVVYVIWQNPWMAVGPKTFIASMLNEFGLVVFPFAEKYPKFEIEPFLTEEYLLLFSSEPYPFRKKRPQMSFGKASAAIVDGEVFSWFGWRSMQVLISSS